MKERPILFSGPMVRAILEGRKTQTRRIIDPGFRDGYGNPGEIETISPDDFRYWTVVEGDGGRLIACPWHVRRLWVRETWTDLDNISTGAAFAAGPSVRYFYRADGHYLDRGGRWKPSIHMPRAASRITLEVVNVRVERLQDISEGDAIAEGLNSWPKRHPARYGFDGGAPHGYATATGAFTQLWNSINKDRAQWDSNPWVWVIEFRRIDE